jgi:hypothetical protein
MTGNDVKHKANKESADCQEKHHLIYNMHGKWNMQVEVTNCIDQNNFCWTYYWVFLQDHGKWAQVITSKIPKMQISKCNV